MNDARAIELFVNDGNPREDWPNVDWQSREWYRREAARKAREELARQVQELDMGY